MPDGSLPLKVDLARSFDMSPYQIALSAASVLMSAVFVNKYFDDWLRARENKRINDRGKEREVIDLRENGKA
jgi:hypothetical protein